MNPADITAGAGQCLLRLGLPDQAAVMLDEGISVFDESFVRDRQLHLTYLSEARAQPGKQRDLDAAAGHGLTAIQLAESLESHLSVGRIHELCRLLTPDADVPAVAEFLERAKGFMEERMQA